MRTRHISLEVLIPEVNEENVGSIFSNSLEPKTEFCGITKLMFSDYETHLVHIDVDSGGEVLAHKDDENFESSRDLSVYFVGIREIGENFGANSSESYESSTIVDEIEDNMAAENCSDFGDNEVVVEDNEKSEEVTFEKPEIVLSQLQISGIIDGSRQSSLDETGLYLIEEYENYTLLELGQPLHVLCVKASHDSSTVVEISSSALYSKFGMVAGVYCFSRISSNLVFLFFHDILCFGSEGFGNICGCIRDGGTSLVNSLCREGQLNCPTSHFKGSFLVKCIMALTSDIRCGLAYVCFPALGDQEMM